MDKGEVQRNPKILQTSYMEAQSLGARRAAVPLSLGLLTSKVSRKWLSWNSTKGEEGDTRTKRERRVWSIRTVKQSLFPPLFHFALIWDSEGTVAVTHWKVCKILREFFDSKAIIVPASDGKWHARKGKCCMWPVKKVEIHITKIGLWIASGPIWMPQSHTPFGAIHV